MTQPVARTTGAFEGFDLEGFWDDGDYSLSHYTEPAPSDELIAQIEAECGYRLPDAYVELARLRNGGAVERCCYPMDEPTGWAEDHIAITGLYAIGRTATYSLCGDLGSAFMRAEWGYPDIGIGIANTPSAGHEMIMLDYRQCGPQGEPRVVHVDQEADFAITEVAPDFATFIRGLVSEDEFNDDAETLEADLATVQRGTLSPILRRALEAAATELPDGELRIRRLAERIVRAKGFFALHADADSHLMYDAMFWLFSHLKLAESYEDFHDCSREQSDYRRPCYTLMLTTSYVADPYGFCTGGYAPGFLSDWWEARLAAGSIVRVEGGYRFAADYAARLVRTLAAIDEPSIQVSASGE
ncbi:SMI1/KNR4 family protein [Pseudomonas sp. PDM20]|uniref:SMI1/KNR4 family protein n=1 Tax=Pseudomonas sp. PDM20 TaxID=2769254 RepID=UPI001780BBB1|nr:SMI1/KNR4 family protein [Pseudomonas sp. PDM20]MBD9684831.1 SMI1/KNR4 family protein [Pseudomonas sp. PDM20]